MPEALSTVAFRQEDVRRCDLPSGTYDLIVTHFVLDCFDEGDLREVVARLAGAAMPNAIWLLSDFQIPEGGWGGWYARVLVRVMYGFFRMVASLKTDRLVDPTPILRAQGFILEHEELTLAGMLKSQLWSRGEMSG